MNELCWNLLNELECSPNHQKICHAIGLGSSPILNSIWAVEQSRETVTIVRTCWKYWKYPTKKLQWFSLTVKLQSI